MIIPIYYFSGTGNTWWVSKNISETLISLGVDAQAFSIEQIKPGNINERISAADIIGLGFPIYGSDAPRIFLRFLDALPILDKPKPVFGFVTQLAWSGIAATF